MDTWGRRDCQIFGQPWFPGALQFRPQVDGDRDTKVIDLVDETSGLWDTNRISDLFGYAAAMQIVSGIKPPFLEAGAGRLIFTLSTSRNFSVKLTYRALHKLRNSSSQVWQDPPSRLEDNIWIQIWKKGQVLPRVKVFLWKLLHNGLPWAAVLAHRLGGNQATCHTCGYDHEDAIHWLSHCPFSGMCWFACQLGLKLEEIEGSLKDIILWITTQTDSDQWNLFANSMWALWRCRNGCAYNGETPTLQMYQRFLNSIATETRLGSIGIGGMTRHNQVATEV